MEKYLSLIILVAPGFIAAKIANILGITSSKRGEIDSIASYLSYFKRKLAGLHGKIFVCRFHCKVTPNHIVFCHYRRLIVGTIRE